MSAQPEGAVPMHLRVGAVTHLVQPVSFGYVTIRFENGRPTLVERHEMIRLTGGGGGAAVAK